jgi:hypothetical protein
MGSRRGGTIDIDNSTGDFTPAYNGVIWGYKRVRISTGLMIGNEPYYHNQGTFIMLDIKVA